MFEAYRALGVDPHNLDRWAYTFSATSKEKLIQLSVYLESAGYTPQEIDFLVDEEDLGDSYLLRVEKSERHTLVSLSERQQELKSIAGRFEVSSDIGFEGLLP